MKTILNDELIENICELVSDGNFIKDAAAINGIPEGTFWNWMKIADDLISDKTRDETSYTDLEKLCVKLSADMRIARAKNKDQHIQNINKAANSGTWQASAWYLERVYKNEFSLRSEIDASVNMKNPITVEVVGVENKDTE